jgi:hypothetical protein
MQNITQVATVKKSTESVGVAEGFNYSDIKIINKQIYAYTLRRSFADNLLFNVVAVDKKGEFISVVETDLTFDEAADKVKELNMELEG